MNCHDINYILDSNAAELLPADQKQAIDHHFESCHVCREAWAAYREMSALQVPNTPQALRSRIAAALAPATKRTPKKHLIVGSVLVVGAAVAATMALRVEDGAPELTGHLEDSAPVATSTSRAGHEAPPAGAHPVENTPDINGQSDSTNPRIAAPLDPNTIVVLSTPNRELNARHAALLDRFYREILQHLQSVPGLNVIRPEHVAPFLAAGTLEEEIARELGAAHLVVLSTSPEPSARLSITPVDVGTGNTTGSMRFTAAFDRRWPARLSSDAADVADFIKEGLTDFTPADRSAAIADARTIVLDSSLPPAERVAALENLPQTTEARTDDIVLAAVELATIAPNLRASIWHSMYGVENPYLIDPLIDSLIYDDAEHRRRAAAAALGTFLAEPRVKAALEQVRASDASEAVREAALFALSTVEERDQLALQALLDEELPIRERLGATMLYEGRRAREVTLTAEAAQAVFDIGVGSNDSGIRAWAWGKLGRSGIDNSHFMPVLLDDLADHPNIEVRTMAVFALKYHSTEPDVRAALEHAENDRSFRVRAAARTVLEEIRQ